MSYLRFALILSVVCVISEGVPVMSAPLPYSVVEEMWPEKYGKHRARVMVNESSDAVRVTLEWRRRDIDPGRKRIFIVDAATNQEITNFATPVLNREYAEIIFQPQTVPGEYFIYYLPYVVQEPGGWYAGDYLPPVDTADAAWKESTGLNSDAWQNLPRGEAVEIQARTQFSSFYPMEIIATKAETDALRNANASAPYLLFPEDRTRPIWMTLDLPYKWVADGPQDYFTGEAMRDEYYVWQIGVWALAGELDDIKVDFTDLTGPDGAVIPVAEMTCFNTGGVAWTGDVLIREASVPAGQVGALWCGVQIPRDARPGEYEGVMTLRPANAPASQVRLSFNVTDQVIEAHGDNDLWRFARLRWMNSRIALDDELTAPYTPLEVKGQTINCLGRSVTFGKDTLPAEIKSGTQDILAAPMRFVVKTAEGDVNWNITAPEITKHNQGAVNWETAGDTSGLKLSSDATMEYDGHLLYRVTLTPQKDMDVADIALEVPFAKKTATYLMGMDHKGGYFKQEHNWKWGGRVYYDSFWMGDVKAGMQVELRGADYCGPMVNLYWNLGQLQPPTTWNNNGAGGVNIKETDASTVLARAYSGARTLKAGEPITFEFALLITPVKPLDTARQFNTRYWHNYDPVEKVVAEGANVVNIHHANEINPFINYPFLENEKLSAYINQSHDEDIKVKIYYTLREMTNHTYEMPALRALGHEIIAPGGGGGYNWLQEHLGSDYSCSWYQQMPDGEACAAIVNTGQSRWYNYYLEGLSWLVQNLGIDGLYNDDVSYDRRVMKRVRKILDRGREGCEIDLHSNTGFSFGPANQYMEFFPFIDRLWFGESFNYNESPDYWLTEICGIPFGLMGDMLQDGGNPWRGMVYGMTVRAPWSGNPRPIWKVWDEFGIEEAKMMGYWEPDCPVRTDNPNVLATAYVRDGKALVSVASWDPKPAKVKLTVDWKALNIDPQKAHFYAPEIEQFQNEKLFGTDATITVMPRRGLLLFVDEVERNIPEYEDLNENIEAEYKLIWEDTFDGSALDPSWTSHISTANGSELNVENGALKITSQSNKSVFIKRELAAGATMVECKLNTGTDGGMTWGPGLTVLFGGQALRINARPTEPHIGIDRTVGQTLIPHQIGPNQDIWFRIRLDDLAINAEVSFDGEDWWTEYAWNRSVMPGFPTTIAIGKNELLLKGDDAYDTPEIGTCQFEYVKVYTNK